jgi:hypothetical protein
LGVSLSAREGGFMENGGKDDVILGIGIDGNMGFPNLFGTIPNAIRIPLITALVVAFVLVAFLFFASLFSLSFNGWVSGLFGVPRLSMVIVPSVILIVFAVVGYLNRDSISEIFSLINL